ncbi:MAG: hypothetical protein WAL85_21400 [Candidatus Korobacteraceae bacterium]
MKIVVLIVRLLLGLVFFVFGLNAFMEFLKGPVPGGLAGIVTGCPTHSKPANLLSGKT